MHDLSVRSCAQALALGLVIFLSGCSASTGECGGCAATEFCCLGVCAPLGASCGGADAGPLDAPLDAEDAAPLDAAPPDAWDGCAPSASATSVESFCDGNGRASCAGIARRDCSERTCVDWIDAIGVAHASCVPSEETEVCDAEVEEPRCDGPIIVACLRGTTAYPADEPAPPGYVHRYDCGEHAADATCQRDGARLVCFSPTDVACDPEEHEDACEAECRLAPYTSLPGVLRVHRCDAGERCVQSDPHPDEPVDGAPRPVCVPTTATPSPGLNADLECVGADSIRVRRYGYEFVERCDDRFLTGGPARCYDAPPDEVGATCIGAASETCDPSTYADACVGDRSRYCDPSAWVVRLESCPGRDGSPFGSGGCDAATGLCVVGGRCDPATFVSYCSTPTTRIVCNEESHRTQTFGPSPCAD